MQSAVLDVLQGLDFGLEKVMRIKITGKNYLATSQQCSCFVVQGNTGDY